jgi:hypothetical protein
MEKKMLSRDEKNLARRVRKWTATAKSWLKAESEADVPIFMSGHSNGHGGVSPLSISLGKLQACLLNDPIVVWSNPYSKKSEYLLYKSFYMKNAELGGYVNITRAIKAMVECDVIQIKQMEWTAHDSYRGLMQLNPLLRS